MPIYGRDYTLNAKVEVMTGMSGHADKDGLLAWAGAMKKKPGRTFVVHGEDEALETLARGLRGELKFSQVDIPDPGQTVEL